jgi:hypothetical protein
MHSIYIHLAYTVQCRLSKLHLKLLLNSPGPRHSTTNNIRWLYNFMLTSCQKLVGTINSRGFLNDKT